MRESELMLTVGKGKSRAEGRMFRGAQESGDQQSPVSTAGQCTEVTSYDWVTAHDYLDLDMDLKPLHVSTKGGM